jgi:hypothetical protein
MVSFLVEAAARARHARLLHPRGRSFTAEWETFGGGRRRWGTTLFDVPQTLPALVRVSKGAPTPTGWPDVLGLAIRLPDSVDLLLSSSARMPVLRHVPLPRRDFGGGYGSLLAYRAGHDRVFLATKPAPGVGDTLDAVTRAATGDGLELMLMAATRWSGWQPVAAVRFGRLLDAETDAALAFNPIVNHAPDLVPVGWLQRLRGSVYWASQLGRGARPAGGTGPAVRGPVPTDRRVAPP